jgi:hypothetical protein
MVTSFFFHFFKIFLNGSGACLRRSFAAFWECADMSALSKRRRVAALQIRNRPAG